MLSCTVAVVGEEAGDYLLWEIWLFSFACCLQVDWLYRFVLHGGPGPGFQLPGPAVWHPRIWQARLAYYTGLHL